MLPNPQETEDLVTFTEKTLNGKLHFLCSAIINFWSVIFIRLWWSRVLVLGYRPAIIAGDYDENWSVAGVSLKP